MKPCILVVEDDAVMAEGICDTLHFVLPRATDVPSSTDRPADGSDESSRQREGTRL